MYELDTVVRGEGWLIHRKDGRLCLVVNDEDFEVNVRENNGKTHRRLTVTLPKLFLTEVFQQKRVLQDAQKDVLSDDSEKEDSVTCLQCGVVTHWRIGGVMIKVAHHANGCIQRKSDGYALGAAIPPRVKP
jgi:hypothetical protein